MKFLHSLTAFFRPILQMPGAPLILPANAFSGLAVINTVATLGDRISEIQGIAMHGAIFA
jgi:hypothetical protein